MLTRNDLLSAIRKSGFTGKDTDAEIKAFVADKELKDESGKALDIDAVLANKKTVTITVAADADEDVQVDNQTEAQDSTEGDSSEDENADKSKKSVDTRKTTLKLFNIGGSKAAHKAYNARAAQGKSARNQTFYPDAEIAEYAGAWFRMKSLGKADEYKTSKWYNEDKAIVKNWVVGTDSSGGSFVPSDIATFYVANLNAWGAARRAAGVTPMGRDVLDISELTSDVVVTWPGQVTAGASNASTPATARRSLNANKMIGTKKCSSELLNDSPLNIADVISESFARAMLNAEDAAYVAGDGTSTYGGFTGILESIDTGSIAIGSGNSWDEMTAEDIDALAGKLPGRFRKPGQAIGYMCSSEFYHRVLARIQRSKGGVSLAEAMNGVARNGNGDGSYFGDPVYFTDYMPTASDDGQVCLLYGNFAAATKFGEVRNSHAVEASEHFAWDLDAITFRGKERVAVLCHDMGTNSVAGGVVALQTASGS